MRNESFPIITDLSIPKMPPRFVGIATCSPNDEWNEEIGRLIAFNRAKDKYNRSFFKHANNLMEEMDNYLNHVEDCFNNYGRKLSEGAAKRKERIDKYFNKTEENITEEENT